MKLVFVFTALFSIVQLLGQTTTPKPTTKQVAFIRFIDSKGKEIGLYEPKAMQLTSDETILGNLQLNAGKYFIMSNGVTKGYFFSKGTDVFNMAEAGGGIASGKVTYEDAGKTVNITYSDNGAIRVLRNANGFIEIWYNNKLAGRAMNVPLVMNSEVIAILCHYFLKDSLAAAIQ